MVAGEAFPFQEDYLPALASQHGGTGTAGRAAADYYYVSQ